MVNLLTEDTNLYYTKGQDFFALVGTKQFHLTTTPITIKHRGLCSALTNKLKLIQIMFIPPLIKGP